MSQIIKGEEIGVFEVTAMSLGKSKKDNRDGVKSRFIAMTLKDEETLGGGAVRDLLFEEDLGTDYINTLALYCKKKDDGNYVTDTKGGFVIDIVAIQKSDGELEKRIAQKLLRRVGGMIESYKFDCPRYSNNADGSRTKDKNGNDVIKDEIQVFTQLKFMVPNAEGGFDKSYFKGMSPKEKGERIVSQFFKEPVAKITPVSTEAANEDGTDEQTPF